jgi:hypothetical protein
VPRSLPAAWLGLQLLQASGPEQQSPLPLLSQHLTPLALEGDVPCFCFFQTRSSRSAQHSLLWVLGCAPPTRHIEVPAHHDQLWAQSHLGPVRTCKEGVLSCPWVPIKSLETQSQQPPAPKLTSQAHWFRSTHGRELEGRLHLPTLLASPPPGAYPS